MSRAHYSCQVLKEFVISREIFGKKLNIEIHENPSSGSRGCYMRTDKRDVRTDMINLIAGLRDFAKHLNKRTTTHNVLVRTPVACKACKYVTHYCN